MKNVECYKWTLLNNFLEWELDVACVFRWINIKKGGRILGNHLACQRWYGGAVCHRCWWLLFSSHFIACCEVWSGLNLWWIWVRFWWGSFALVRSCLLMLDDSFVVVCNGFGLRIYSSCTFILSSCTSIILNIPILTMKKRRKYSYCWCLVHTQFNVYGGKTFMNCGLHNPQYILKVLSLRIV